MRGFSVPREASEDTGEVLVDRTASGRERPWREKKLAALRVAGAYGVLGQAGKAARCRGCGTVLEFAECLVDGQKRLQRANFCRERLCPMCAWRRSLKWAAEASVVLHQAAVEHAEWGWVMLTLTQRNVAGERLPGEIGRLLRGWDRLTKRQEFSAVAGWLRTLEVTRNDRTGEWHPHIHVLLAVEPDYWAGRNYVSHARWVAVWREVLGLDYEPSVEVHRVRSRGPKDALMAAAQEVAKYTVKDADLVGDGADVVEWVRVLDVALKGRRLLAWGGALRRIARQVTVPEGEEDLVRIAGEDHGPTCPVCGGPLRERVYRWIEATLQYVG